MMGDVNVTIRVNEETKRDFDLFRENVGMNNTTARESLKQAFKAAQEQSVKNGTDKMTMEEIDAEIAAYRREKRQKQC